MKPETRAKLVLAAADGPPDKRIAACDRLVRDGHFDEVVGPLEQLAALPATASEARKLIAICRQLKRWGIVGQLEAYTHQSASAPNPELLPDFAEKSGALIARRPRADKVIFVFSGAMKKIWVSLHLLHQMLPKQDCHIVYLRDDDRCCYLTGVGGFGDSYDAALSGMRELVAALGDPRVFCIGSSGGGYAALRYGLDLGAQGVLAFSPSTDPSHLPAAFKGTFLEGFCEQNPHVTTDLREAYATAVEPPVATLVFGGAHEEDTAASRRMQGLPTITLCPIEGYDRHDAISQTLASGQFPGLIRSMLEA